MDCSLKILFLLWLSRWSPTVLYIPTCLKPAKTHLLSHFRKLRSPNFQDFYWRNFCFAVSLSVLVRFWQSLPFWKSQNRLYNICFTNILITWQFRGAIVDFVFWILENFAANPIFGLFWYHKSRYLQISEFCIIRAFHRELNRFCSSIGSKVTGKWLKEHNFEVLFSVFSTTATAIETPYFKLDLWSFSTFFLIFGTLPSFMNNSEALLPKIYCK